MSRKGRSDSGFCQLQFFIPTGVVPRVRQCCIFVGHSARRNQVKRLGVGIHGITAIQMYLVSPGKSHDFL